MDIYDALFSAVFNILGVYANIRVIKLFLNQKSNNRILNMCLYTFAWGINWIFFYKYQNPNLTTLSLFVGLLLVVYIIYEGNFLKKIVSVVIAMGLGISSENIVWFLLFTENSPIKSEAVGSICSALLTLTIILIIEKFLLFNKTSQLPRLTYWNIIFISVASVILADILVISESLEKKLVMLGLSLICLINISIYYLYEKVEMAYQQTVRTAIMEQQIKMYTNQFDIIYESQKNIRSLRHDIKNHLLMISSYLLNTKYEEAIHYVEDLGGKLQVENEFVKSGNFEIDSILNYKLKKAELLGCKVNTKVVVPAEEFMSVLDLNIILGNLLDNAIEATQNIIEKNIDIYLKYMMGVVYISIYNSYDGNLIKTKERFLSTKTASITKHLGIGLENIKEIVHKYDGIIEIKHDESTFKVDIVLFTTTTGVH